MKKRILLWVVLLIASGYVLDFGFKAMNLDSDFGYIGGILGIVLWVFLLVWIYEKTSKEKSLNDKVSAAGTVGVSGVERGMHN